MAFKVNYGLERAERNRVKQAKKEAKAAAKKAQPRDEHDAQPAPEDEKPDEAPPAGSN